MGHLYHGDVSHNQRVDGQISPPTLLTTVQVVVSTGTGMAAISMLAGFSLRSSSRMSRSMIGATAV